VSNQRSLRVAAPLDACRVALLVGLLSAVAAPSSALPGGRATITPDLDTLPVRGFRLEMGVVGIENVVSVKNGRRGDLWGPAVRLDYGAARNVVLSVDGIAYKSFVAEQGGGSAAVGDFTVWGKVILAGDPGEHRGWGVRFGAKLPNTPSGKDFGTNESDVFVHVFGGTDVAGWRVSAYGGIGILGRPGVPSAQDDVAMGGVLARRPAAGGLVGVEVEGFTSSRLWGDNWALHMVWEHPADAPLSYMVAGQLSHGRLYGAGALRAGLVLRF
jgi:hypothetical protein